MVERRQDHRWPLGSQISHEFRQRAQHASRIEIDQSHACGDFIEVRTARRGQHEMHAQPQRREFIGQLDKDALGAAAVQRRQKQRNIRSVR